MTGEDFLPPSHFHADSLLQGWLGGWEPEPPPAEEQRVTRLSGHGPVPVQNVPGRHYSKGNTRVSDWRAFLCLDFFSFNTMFSSSEISKWFCAWEKEEAGKRLYVKICVPF